MDSINNQDFYFKPGCTNSGWQLDNLTAAHSGPIFGGRTISAMGNRPKDHMDRDLLLGVAVSRSPAPHVPKAVPNATRVGSRGSREHPSQLPASGTGSDHAWLHASALDREDACVDRPGGRSLQGRTDAEGHGSLSAARGSVLAYGPRYGPSLRPCQALPLVPCSKRTAIVRPIAGGPLHSRKSGGEAPNRI